MSRQYGVRAPEEIRLAVSGLVRDRGTVDAAKVLQISVTTIARLVLGDQIQHASYERVTDALAQLSPVPTATALPLAG